MPITTEHYKELDGPSGVSEIALTQNLAMLKKMKKKSWIRPFIQIFSNYAKQLNFPAGGRGIWFKHYGDYISEDRGCDSSQIPVTPPV